MTNKLKDGFFHWGWMGCALLLGSLRVSWVGAQTLSPTRRVTAIRAEKKRLAAKWEMHVALEAVPMGLRYIQCDGWTFRNGLASYLRMTFLADPEARISRVYAESLAEQSSAAQTKTPLIGWHFFEAGNDLLSPIGAEQSKKRITRCGQGLHEYQKSYRMSEGYPHDSFYSICVPKNFYSKKIFPVQIHEYKAFLSGDRENHFLPELQCSGRLN